MIPQPDGTKLLDVQHVSRMFQTSAAPSVAAGLLPSTTSRFLSMSVRPENLHAGRGERKRQDDAVPHAR